MTGEDVYLFIYLFTVEYHHGGYFIHKPSTDYVGGIVSYEGGVDEDETSLIEVMNAMRVLDYGGSFKVWYMKQNKQLSNGHRLLNSDHDVYQVFMEHIYCRRIVFYIEHLVESVEVVDDVNTH